MVPSLLPDPTKPFAQQDECVLLGMAVFGESRNQGMRAKLGVACCVRNRVNAGGKYGQGYAGVILKPWQFSSFNENDPNHGVLLEPTKHELFEVWDSCYTAAYLVYRGAPDVTRNAVFYFSKPLTEPPKKSDGSCAWGKVELTAVIGDLHFYREAR